MKFCPAVRKFGTTDNVRPMTEKDRADILAANKGMADKALRVLAAAYRDYASMPGRLLAGSA